MLFLQTEELLEPPVEDGKVELMFVAQEAESETRSTKYRRRIVTFSSGM